MNAGLPLKLKRIAVPETRELDVLSGLLERRGAEVLRFPLIAIHDSPNPEEVKIWLLNFIANPPAWIILLTGEGLRRLVKFIDRHEIDKLGFIEALSYCKILSRGPKPAKVLREIGLTPTALAEFPTTPGVIASLEKEDINGLSVAVQLYGDDPNTMLIEYLETRGAQVSSVAPYVYADDADKSKVLELISLIERHELDVIAFTSKTQVNYLYRIAHQEGCIDSLTKGLNNLLVAAVGPIVGNELENYFVKVGVMPDKRYFMKPLVSEIVNAFQAASENKGVSG